MNYNFTDRSRKVLAMSREEAIRLQHDYVGTEHILLGLLREGQGVASAVLHAAGLDAEEIRQTIGESIRPGKGTIALGELPYTSRAKKTLEYAMAAARDFRHDYIGTEHFLVGLMREEKGIAAQVLNKLGLTLSQSIQLTLSILAGPTSQSPAQFRIRIDDTSETSIYEQIIAQVQEGVATGKLAPGDRLPAVRQLADELDIAPGTVARAYSDLESRGVVITEGARGTRIADRSRKSRRPTDHAETLSGLLRPVAVAAFHLGATADDLRTALERAMTGIFDSTDPEVQQ
jgi:DNA-binding transcriptional regulator YhcF (GntR family)